MTHHKNYLALLMIAFSITIFVCAMYGYLHYSIGRSIDRVLAAREVVKKEEIFRSQKQNLTDMYTQTTKDRALLPSFFVSDDKKVAFIERIESFGAITHAKVTLSGIVADDLATSPRGTLGRISMHVDAIGTWEAVMRVLKLAETLPYKSSVSAVRVDYSGVTEGKDAKGQWRLSFVLDTVSIR